MAAKKEKIERGGVSHDKCEALRRVVLVGTYRGDQLTKWRGWYNYPISEDDFSRVEHVERVEGRAGSPLPAAPDGAESPNFQPFNLSTFQRINELWLFNGTKDERRYKAEFVGVKTRQELIDDYGYPAKGKAHGDRYLLFKTEFKYRHKLDVPEDAEAVIIRTRDFATAPKVRKQLKAYLESPDRRDPDLAKRLPEVITKLRPAQLRVCEAAVQSLDEKVMTSQQQAPDRGISWIEALSSREDGNACNADGRRVWRAVSLFAGAGGCSLGAKEAGIKLIGAYEIADPAIRTYLRNFGKGSCLKEDLSSCDFEKLRNGLGLPRGDLDLLIGGPPCQGFTTAGSRMSDDPRNRLVENYSKALDAFFPRWFLMENVEGILTTAHGEFLAQCIRAATRIGYSMFLRKVYMQEYGIPQRRKRVILVGNRMGKDFAFPKSECAAYGGIFRKGAVSLRDAIGDIENCDIPEVNHVRHVESGIRLERIKRLKEGQTMRDLPDWLQHESYRRRASRRVCDGTPSEKRGGAPVGLKRLYYDEPCLTITGSAIAEFVHPVQDRMLTVRECARIQTFPDNFVFCGTDSQQMTQIGNAIPPKFAERMIQQIRIFDRTRSSAQGVGLVRFDVTKASARSPALESTCRKLKTLMPGQATQMTLEI